jgi:hypothetical protein
MDSDLVGESMILQENILETEARSKAGHYEILGETYAKFEFFENGWNPYSRFLDVDKVDLILRRKHAGRVLYREVQVKFGKLYDVGSSRERKLFDVTSWRFFKENEFDGQLDQRDFFVAYVLSRDKDYQDDIFIFPIRDFAEIIQCGILSGGKRKVYISRSRHDQKRWFLRRRDKFEELADCMEVTKYRRNFGALKY